jgi:hypothetical protein
VSGGDGIKVMPFAAIVSFHLLPKPFSPSDLMYRVVNPQFVFVIARNSLVTDTSSSCDLFGILNDMWYAE